MGCPRERFTTTNRRQRLRESQDVHECDVDEPSEADVRRGRHGRGCDGGNTGARQTDHSDEHREHQDSDADPHGSRPDVVIDVTAHARAQPQPPNHDDGDECREVLCAHGALEAQARDGHHDDIGDVVSNDDRGEGAEDETLDECEGHGRSCGAPAKRVPDPADQTAGNEEGPALDLNRP